LQIYKNVQYFLKEAKMSYIDQYNVPVQRIVSKRKWWISSTWQERPVMTRMM